MQYYIDRAKSMSYEERAIARLSMTPDELHKARAQAIARVLVHYVIPLVKERGNWGKITAQHVHDVALNHLWPELGYESRTTDIAV